MRLYSYVVARDFGFAPNPFYEMCTLATCKADIRRLAQIDDVILGTGSARRHRAGHVVYIMRVTEVVSYDTYWSDPRFALKKPNLHGSKKQAFGDNIYHRSADSGPWIQANSHHSHADGSPNPSNIAKDTKSTNVLVSSDFVYFGGEGPQLPERFRSFDQYDLCVTRGYKNQFPGELVQKFTQWWRALDTTGYAGVPLDWARTP